MASPEKKVKQKVRAILDSFGAVSFMPMSGGYSAAGTSDIVACYLGKFIAIETKATAKDKATALQRLFARSVHNADGVVMLIHADNTHLVGETLQRVRAGVDVDNYVAWPGLFDEETV
jgi:hypothetical protein